VNNFSDRSFFDPSDQGIFLQNFSLKTAPEKRPEIEPQNDQKKNGQRHPSKSAKRFS
jgi:hypothetical protein